MSRKAKILRAIAKGETPPAGSTPIEKAIVAAAGNAGGGGVNIVEYVADKGGTYHIRLNGEDAPTFVHTSDDDYILNSKEWYEKLAKVAREPWILYQTWERNDDAIAERAIIGDAANGITAYEERVCVNSAYIYNQD